MKGWWWAAAAAGDEKAYAELLGRYKDAIYYMLLKMVNNKSSTTPIIMIRRFAVLLSMYSEGIVTFGFSKNLILFQSSFEFIFKLWLLA